MLRDEYGVVIAGAQEHIKGKVIRLGHMGVVTFPELAGGIAAIESALHKKGYTGFQMGAGVAEVVKRM